MNLHECFALAFSHHAVEPLALDANPIAGNNSLLTLEGEVSFLTDTSSTHLRKGSILSVLQCIVSEWGTKAQTNFYIPPEHYAGYSYLFEDGEQPGWHSFENEYPQYLIHTHAHLKEHHHRPSFVYAEEPNNLHPHHYDVYIHGTGHPSVYFTRDPSNNDSAYKLSHHSHHSTLIPLLPIANINVSHIPMTVPYIHPNLDLPVPPLHLPWYFGALCWSFALAGIAMLYLPQKWALYGGRRLSGEKEAHRRHWFPYRAFAWTLILFQSPCSFLADYIHMTNISSWHTIDRFLACNMMSLELVKLISMRTYTRPLIYMLNLICCGVALFCFLKSQKSQQTLDGDGFVFWHCGWHCYPISASVVHMVEHFLNARWGEFNSFEPETESKREECAKRGERVGILLSKIAMNRLKIFEETHPESQPEASDHDTTIQKQFTPKSKTSSHVTNTSGMASPLRRSRRIAGQKPEMC
mmetsp:Transcript_3520/g.8973  ORF Transcript_3520/g.8973 Transcript_3520/m.8973 type:complete len:467 (-) Transcript_3520:228-1628(-)|eukprot:CAMPEP_0181120984 /NCGR_PEP_ID=MMETSP1071-20121207/24477_1 /TAXON_ID=35127 /ORGANISM="Thalassiosira sp., Strain NH16" /LENGTH=466 /DNA_ID=CAMNT_0023205735 /DNA_START=260 /DNA_END=1660 /DNA_ORIENTATION=+